MWVYERDTLRFLEVSDGAVRQYGYSRAEFLEMTTQALRPAGCRYRRCPRYCSYWSAAASAPPRWRPMSARMAPWFRSRSAPMCWSTRGGRAPGGRARRERGLSLCEELAYSGAARSRDRPGQSELLRQRAEEAFEGARKTQRRVALVRMELDQIEQVTERFGVAAIDACLKQVGLWLTRRVRGMDTVARTSKKEFTLVLAELDDDFDLYRVATALLKVFSEPALVQGVPVPLSASLGIAVYPEDAQDLRTAMPRRPRSPCSGPRPPAGTASHSSRPRAANAPSSISICATRSSTRASICTTSRSAPRTAPSARWRHCCGCPARTRDSSPRTASSPSPKRPA